MTHLGQSVDGGFTGAVGSVIMESEDGSCTGCTDDLPTLPARYHPPRTFLRHDKWRPHVHLEGISPQINICFMSGELEHSASALPCEEISATQISLSGTADSHSWSSPSLRHSFQVSAQSSPRRL